MAETTFNTTAGQTIARKLLMAFLNTGTAAAPVWSIIGKRVEDSSQEYDWNKESKQDILGNTFTTMSTPTVTQTFDPCNLDAGEVALTKLWQLAVKDQDVSALAEQDMMIVHKAAFLPLVAIWYIVTELGSITENAAKLGAPVPKFLINCLAKLKDKADEDK